ncbi:glycosyl hydrolase 2 galactose-binding domain-containing protein [Parapedobacter tibetensis]|uniref:glycosyl hydrolase 2 galactose-binding domain-containing protein n=1 Tax=Parapedobacter tibetensis TaxID=2972951 RepID=UPI00214DCD69|nr:sugar-binding domain-containing protein [Parapedobacter tibetensis]
MRKYVCGLLCYLQLFAVVAQQGDRFAEIGNKVPAVRTHLLVTPQPPTLPEKQLPTVHHPSAMFQPMDRLDNEAELAQALDTMRAHFLPFMKQLAPDLKQYRVSMSLDSFQWRKETTDDRKDFLNVLQGGGAWQPVSIPHFGEPLGKSVTYYRTIFRISPEMRQKDAVYIHFNGVDYKAQVFVNKQFIGAHEGVFAPFEFDIADALVEGENVLLVKVENDVPMQGGGDKLYAATGPGYDEPKRGWHHCPPGMGIYQQVHIEGRSHLHIHDVFVRPLGTTDTAEIWLEVNNSRQTKKTIRVRYAVFGQNFEQEVLRDQVYQPRTVHVPGVGDLAKKTDHLEKDLLMGQGPNFLKFRVVIPNARRWNNDTPWLYQLQLELLDEHDEVVDSKAQQFGMRHFEMDTVSAVKGMLYLDGKPIRLRGANTMGAFQQAVMNGDDDRLIDDILLAKLTHMNFIRMTQMPVQDEIYCYCDQLGLMTQTDLPLFGVLRRNQWLEAVRQAEEMERLVRKHPCNIMVTYINERFPNAEGNPHRHLNTYDEYARFFRAADEAVLMANPDRVIKAGDGDYDPPSPGLPDNHCYNGWYNGHGLGLGELFKGHWIPVKPDWYYACGEFGSEGLESVETMRKYYPASWLPQTEEEEKDWSPSKIPAAQTGRFHYMWFNTGTGLADWVEASQSHQETISRLTTEAFRRDNRMVSFAIHLFIDAFPSGWMKAIMDVDRKPKKAWYAYREALTPLAVQLRTDRFQAFSGDTIPVEAWIVNDLGEAPAGYNIRYQLELDGKVLSAAQSTAEIQANASSFQGYWQVALPTVKRRKEATLRIALFDDSDNPVHERSETIALYPAAAPAKAAVWLANRNGTGMQLSDEMDCTVVNEMGKADVLVIDDINDYINDKDRIEAQVIKGKRLVFLTIPQGVYNVGADSIWIKPCSMGSYYFVSPQTGHPMVKQNQPLDFRFWYDANKKVIRPFLEAMLVAEGWSAILKTGDASWGGGKAPDHAMAVAEQPFGKGKIRICQLALHGRVRDNPAVSSRIIEIKMESISVYENYYIDFLVDLGHLFATSVGCPRCGCCIT